MEIKKPTAKQIEAEVAALTEMKPHVRHYTAFNEDNHAAIEAQIETLSKGLRESQLYDRFEPRDDEGEPDNSGNNRAELDSALEAYRWREGEEKEKPSTGWKVLDSRT